MQLTLTSDDAALLRDVLEDHLPALAREVARTEAKGLRHELVRRQELVERLLVYLGTDSQAPAT